MKNNRSYIIRTVLLFCLVAWQVAVIADSPVPPQVIRVSTAQTLQRALDNARPGDIIELADGIYEGRFKIRATVNGTADNPIILKGSRKAVLDAGSVATGYVLHVQASFWTIQGMTIRNGLKGIMADGVQHTVMDSVMVTNIGEEGIHLRQSSKHNTIRNVTITHTGLKIPGFGEGIYIGSAKNNWAKHAEGLPDRCDSNSVLHCFIGPAIAAECIDVKEGTTGGIIRFNVFDATGITGENAADSWIDVKGNSYLIADNKGLNPDSKGLQDGYQVHCAVDGWGCDNVFKNNVCQVNGPGYGIKIALNSSNGKATGNKVYNNNVTEGAAKGLTNIKPE